MRVVVTGGAGFIGAALVRRLLAEGQRVAVLDNFWRGSMANLEAVKSHPDLTVIEGDVANPADVQRCHDALGGVDLVHHLAAINGTKWFHEAAMDVIDVNVNGTLVALRHALEWEARFVLASSPEAYGENERMPLGEEDISRFPSAADHQ
ncbi:MAG: SDR family NAD(P)-dependent oxidoreductase, partial [Candidatus Thermoplasmatota archaeon]|nr:SDR family NAD(P)-dependent oxidoreductase [Candidatus Thermoplasmatota archaeon]